ncbi:Major Facilitator Superfamily protein [Micromonospora sp. MW-13]|uniref:MFS transporter n=1 Tax=Micromonospora sp. MW-13 TaxID=2094022 RepID=UPI000E436419|nr:MFS transporter [Micromonospora sp. MW-13]RGC65477.1 Major Facilitator Superfamily protein [Micromonospora sp. MW-13]
MVLISARVSGGAVRRLSVALYGYAFLTDFVLLYPLYALLFSDTGLSLWQISSLFVVWSVAGVVLEVPSGAWADAVSRRLLLCLAPLCAAAGFALWVLVPSYPAFAVGFLLWGAGGALRSGALEALVFTELERLGAAGRYARVMGRARTAEMLAVVASILVAGPVFGWGGYPAVGAASVLACLAAAVVAAALPGRRAPGGPVDADAGPGWWDSLRSGLAEVRADRRVRGAVLLVAVVTAVWGAVDEYVPLLARESGVTASTVPLLVLMAWAGVTVGGLLAPVGERWGRRGLAGLLAVAALALAVGAGVGRPAGFVLIGVAFAAFQLATVLVDARLQAGITGPGRATVTSLAGMGTDLTIVLVYGGYGLVATAAGNRLAFVWAAVPYLVVALVLAVGRRVRR